MIRLHDTASMQVRQLALREPGKVSMYVCGPTVSGLPHLGHGRFSLVFDVLRRYLEWSGFEVTYVSNVTDIEDKILRAAAAEGVSDTEVADRYEREWWRAMDLLGVKRPDAAPHATAYVAQMVDAISELLERGKAYAASDGVYLSVRSIDGYGLLAHQDLDTLRAGGSERLGEEGGDKRDPADFTLWKAAKPGERSWPAPFGDGRPGWHTECVVMSLDLLGEGFDVHGGGFDLAFPHHENERAQAVGLGREFARHWVHNGFVTDETGEKMSKSLGNVTGLLGLCEVYDPRALRALLLQSHYRSPLTVSPASIEGAAAYVASLDRTVRRLRECGVDLDAVALDRDALAPWQASMDDDLKTPHAMSLVADWATGVNAALDVGDRDEAARLGRLVVEATAAVGLVLRGEPDEVDAGALALARRRDEARAARDWATSDRLRDELKAAGWVVEDTAQGTRLRRP